MQARAVLVVSIVAFLSTACSMIPLLEAMLGTRKPNQMIPGQLFANGGGGHAGFGPDHVAHIAVVRRPRETILHPSLIIMSRPGDLEITFSNNDPQAHLLLIAQSDGGQQVLDLPPLQAGRTRVHYGTPGLYLLANAVGNEMGQGEMGFVLVQGEAPDGARLDRPAQRRP